MKALRCAALVLVAVLGAALGAAAQAGEPLTGRHADPQGRTAIIIGQTADGIRDYVLDSRLPLPWGLTLYVTPKLDSAGFTLADGSKSVNDVRYRVDYGPQDLGFLSQTPALRKAALAVGYWLGAGGGLDVDLASGSNISGLNDGQRLWANTQRMIADLKATGRPVLLRIGYEAEGPWNGHWPPAYRQVWLKMRQEIRRQGADNIATVWQLAAFCPAMDYWDGGITPGRLVAARPVAAPGKSGVQSVSADDPGAVYDQWYPGDDAVDWTAISVFNPQDCSDGYATLQKVVDYLGAKGKPILVAEAAARGYDYDPASGRYAYQQTGQVTRSQLTPAQVWQEWYAPFLQFLRRNRESIRAVAMISDDWTRYPHWQCRLDAQGRRIEGCAEGNWGNTRLDVDPQIRARWLAELTADGRWLKDRP